MRSADEKSLYRTGLALLALAAAAVPVMRIWLPRILERVPSSCVLYRFFGIYCPGCGGTRSVNALLHGHVIMSLWYHPMVPYCVVLYLAYMVSWTFARFGMFGVKRGMKFRIGYIYGLAGLVAVNFIIKNVLKLGFGIAML